METQRGEGEKGGLGVSVLTAGLKWNEMNWRNTLDLLKSGVLVLLESSFLKGRSLWVVQP